MTTQDINARYLVVGYDKRKEEPKITALKRVVMGRKGIGKLAVFAIASRVEVHSVKDGDVGGLRMVEEDIKEKIKDKDSEQVYNPEPINPRKIHHQAYLSHLTHTY